MAAWRSTLKKLLCEADLLVPDGAGVVLASKILGSPLKERVAGFDLTNRLFAFAKKRNSLSFAVQTRCCRRKPSKIFKPQYKHSSEE